MKKDILRYRHHLLVLLALVVANFFIVPLINFQQEQATTIQLLSRQLSKANSVSASGENYKQLLQEQQNQVSKINNFLFKGLSEDKFKINAQSSIEKAILANGCSIDRIGFKNSESIVNSITKWVIDVRFKGDIKCMISATRAIESLSPVVSVKTYNFNHRNLTKQLEGSLNGQMKLNVWYKVDKF